jgi:hypothetical protein
MSETDLNQSSGTIHTQGMIDELKIDESDSEVKFMTPDGILEDYETETSVRILVT